MIGLLMVSLSMGEEIPRAEHPRPDFQRADWLNLNGPWQFCFDSEGKGIEENWQQDAGPFDLQITVPFCWESKLSGIAVTSPQQVGWYRRTVTVPESFGGKRIWLCFGAVDWEARVWVNGREVGRHEGGYTPFALDITDAVEPGQQATLVVRASDATDFELPHGKQGGRWYTPVSGIWQTVYLEARPAAYVEQIRLTPAIRRGEWVLEVELQIVGPDGRVEVTLESPDPTVRKHQAALEIVDGRAKVETALRVDEPKLWSPDEPHLYDLTVRLKNADGSEDSVSTYFGLRTIERGTFGELPHEVILLNGEPIYLRGALDQSFNPEGIYTAPDDRFMRRDMELARSLGLNFLRIHIKAEEPRRLYWADRIGILIMEDMPSTSRQTARARAAWEQTMRATIRRDRNHPSIIAWCLFNESWGLGGRKFKDDRDTQQWVERMFLAVKEGLDPSRLVEDNSPCLNDHVRTDLNSWHFYIDEYRQARRHIEGVVRNTRPGSPLNYVPGRKQGTAPLINSEYGAVSARGGDRDVSWGFRYLTTQLRRHEPIQGYVYTELTDIEWEHNGLLNYDRSAKEFGYDAFVPEMTVADLQGADFVGFDAAPAFEAEPGEQFTVPVFVSHFSRRTRQPTLEWHLEGVNDRGRLVTTDVESVVVPWEPYRVTFLEQLQIRVPAGRPFVGALVLELIDADGQRIAANFMNLIVRSMTTADTDQPRAEELAPRVEVLAPRLVAVRFEPEDFAELKTDYTSWDWIERRGKYFATGQCEVEYHLALPEFVRLALPTKVALMMEVATKADHQRLDWPAVRRPLDYPQTQARKHPGRLSVRLADFELFEVDLQDDPADAAGVLSHFAQFQRGSYGQLIRKKVDLTRQVTLRETLRDKTVVPLVFRTVDPQQGLSIYGPRLGRYVVDPTLIIQTARDMMQPVGWVSDHSAMVHRLIDRVGMVKAMQTGEQGGHAWRFSTKRPTDDWTEPEFDHSSWRGGRGGFGHGASPAVEIHTRWATPDLWLRSTIQLPQDPSGLILRRWHDGDIEIHVNGKLLLQASGALFGYEELALSDQQRSLFREGNNSIAVHCRKTRDGQGVDLGLKWIEIAR